MIDVVLFGSGGSIAFAIDASHRLSTWGGDALLTPTAAADGVVLAGAGDGPFFSIATDGTLWAKGVDSYGQLGAWNIDSSSWVQVEW